MSASFSSLTGVASLSFVSFLSFLSSLSLSSFSSHIAIFPALSTLSTLSTLSLYFPPSLSISGSSLLFGESPVLQTDFTVLSHLCCVEYDTVLWP